MESHDATRRSDAGASDRLLATYLRDHFAGSTAGLALIRRCRRNNAGDPLDDLLGPIETQIVEDRQALLEIMASLGVAPSSLKSALGSMAEMVGRLKTNGRIFNYSASSRVVELEGLAAGIATQRNLWRALRAAAAHYQALHSDQLDTLIGRATSQYDRVVEAHGWAAAEAFAPQSVTP
jgi:hypothetical protein